MAVVDELVTLLGFEMSPGAKAALDKAKAGVENLKKSALAMTAVAATTMTGVAAYAISVANSADEMDKMSQATGISTDALQEWNYAAKKVGADAKTVQNDMVKLREQFGKRMSLEAITGKIAVRMEGMNDRQQQDYAKRLGISSETMILLKQGKAGVAALRAEAHKMGAVIPPESIKVAALFKRTLDTVWTVIRNLGAQVAIGVMPHMQRFLDVFLSWITANREIVSGTLGAVLRGIGKGFETISKALGAVWELVKSFLPDVKTLGEDFDWLGILTETLEGVIIALGLVLSPLIIKFALIGAAIAAVGMIVNDVVGYFRGQNSVLGEAIKCVQDLWDKFGQKFPAIKKLVEDVAGAIKSVFWGAIEGGQGIFTKVFDAFVGYLKAFIQYWSDIFTAVDKFIGKCQNGFPTVSDALNAVADLLKGVFMAAINLVSNAFAAIFKPFGAEISAVKGWINDIAACLKNILGGAIQWVADKFDAMIGPLKDAYNFIEGKIGGAAQGVVTAIDKAVGGEIPEVAGNPYAKDDGRYAIFANSQKTQVPVPASQQKAPVDNRQITYNQTNHITSPADPAAIGSAAGAAMFNQARPEGPGN